MTGKHAAQRTDPVLVTCRIRTTLLWYLALATVGTAISLIAKMYKIPPGDSVKLAGLVIVPAVAFLMRPWRF
jgi:hypothetical protein